jgi:hypothetical protein
MWIPLRADSVGGWSGGPPAVGTRRLHHHPLNIRMRHQVWPASPGWTCTWAECVHSELSMSAVRFDNCLRLFKSTDINYSNGLWIVQISSHLTEYQKNADRVFTGGPKSPDLPIFLNVLGNPMNRRQLVEASWALLECDVHQSEANLTVSLKPPLLVKTPSV